MDSIKFFVRLLATVIGTLFGVIILIRLINRVPGVVVALSALLVILYSVAFAKGSIAAIGIRSRKVAAYLLIASVILLAVSTFMLFRVK